MTIEEIKQNEKANAIIEFHSNTDLVLMSRKWFTDLAEILNSRISKIEKLEQEIQVLRSYGNKDCTSMADAELDRLRNQNSS